MQWKRNQQAFNPYFNLRNNIFLESWLLLDFTEEFK
jgi:hypothetical protein